MQIIPDKARKERITINVNTSEFLYFKKILAYIQMTKAIGLHQTAEQLTKQFVAFQEKNLAH